MTQKEKQIQEGLRLKEVLNSLKIKGNRFAKEVGVSQALVSSALSGEKPITRNFVNKITQRYPKLRESWVFTGEYPIWIPEEGVETYQIDDEESEVSEPDEVEGYGLIEKLQAEVHSLRHGLEDLKKRFEEFRAGNDS